MKKFIGIIPFISDNHIWTVYLLLGFAAALFILLYFTNDTILHALHYNKIPKWGQKVIKAIFVGLALYGLSNFVFLESSQPQLETNKSPFILLSQLFVRQPSPELKIIDFLAIFGTILAVVSWREAVEETEEVHRILESLPTRYIHSFPHHLKAITKLIEDAQESFYILADCADYGSFSNPKGHKEMIEAIYAKNAKREDDGKEKIQIEVMICGEAQAISRSSEFWEKWQNAENNTEAWEELCQIKKFQDRVKEYRKYNSHIEPFDLANCSRDDFELILLDKNKRVEKELHDKLGVTITPLDNLDYLPGVFFWMRDGEDAVFVLSHAGPRIQGMAFFTRDTKIIETFNAIWKRLPNENTLATDRISEFKFEPSLNNLNKLFPGEKRKQINYVLKYAKRNVIL